MLESVCWQLTVIKLCRGPNVIAVSECEVDVKMGHLCKNDAVCLGRRGG